jgi:hypothetical protein
MAIGLRRNPLEKNKDMECIQSNLNFETKGKASGIESNSKLNFEGLAFSGS